MGNNAAYVETSFMGARGIWERNAACQAFGCASVVCHKDGDRREGGASAAWRPDRAVHRRRRHPAGPFPVRVATNLAGTGSFRAKPRATQRKRVFCCCKYKYRSKRRGLTHDLHHARHSGATQKSLLPGCRLPPGHWSRPGGLGFLLPVAAGVVHACSLFFLPGAVIANAAEIFVRVRNG